MQNNTCTPTLYKLEIDSYVVRSAKLSYLFFHFAQKLKNNDRVAIAHMTRATLPHVQ
jgi:hypothetical protein